MLLISEDNEKNALDGLSLSVNLRPLLFCKIYISTAIYNQENMVLVHSLSP